MPAPTTTDELLDLIRKSELIAPQRLDAFMAQVRAASSASSPRELARLLLAAGLITGFQAEQFLQGKWRGFTLGKYRVLERVGCGGMGTVYLCEHVTVGRKVAIKVLPSSQAHNPSALGRFYREARAAGVLDHPNLVRAHDIDQDAGLHFLVMDYVDGSSLQAIVARFGPLSVARAANYVSQAAEGLQHAHKCGLLHRDVKPANIMLERNGAIRVLDLGLARFLHDNSDPLTLKYDDKNVLGTADYVSPEQALDSHDVDIRTDVYSLGATFYFLLTGKPPFPDGSAAQKLIWHQVRQPTSLRQLRPDVPEPMCAVVEKMMAKMPGKRYQTPQEVIKALRRWTAEPVPPPDDGEMPHLSPAAAPARPHPARRESAPGPRRPAASSRQPALRPEDRLAHLATLDRAPSSADHATPRVLSSSHTPTATPRFAPVPPPDQPLASAPEKENERRYSNFRLALLGLGLVTISALAGMTITLSIVGR
jgi:serine/threonine protein kinase